MKRGENIENAGSLAAQEWKHYVVPVDLEHQETWLERCCAVASTLTKQLSWACRQDITQNIFGWEVKGALMKDIRLNTSAD